MALVTVVMAAHNAVTFLPEAIDSIRAQTFKAWKLIVVDDASDDGTSEYLDGLKEENIDIIRLPSKSGQGTARNIAIERCESEFVAIMDADDLSHPNRLAEQVRYLRSHPAVGAVGTQFQYLGNKNRRGFGSLLPSCHNQIYANLMAGKHAVVNATVMFRTSLLKASGGYGPSRVGEDWAIFLRIGEISQLANLTEMLYLYRVHDRSTSAQSLAEMRLQYAYAIEAAHQRRRGASESSFEDFVGRWRNRPVHQKLRSAIETAALANYRRAITNVLYGRIFVGYHRLLIAATLSPSLTLNRLVRIAKGMTLTRRVQA